MSDDYHLEIPPSFLALYLAPGGSKLLAPKAQVLADYELCEDMAQLLAPTAADMQFKLGVTEHDVMTRCLAGLLEEGAVVPAAQAHWVVRRMAEILHWPWQNLENVVKSNP